MLCRISWFLVQCVEAQIVVLRRVYTNIAQIAQVSNFAAECAAGGASDALGLIFVLSASNLEHDYLGLHAVLKPSTRLRVLACNWSDCRMVSSDSFTTTGKLFG